MASDRTSEPFSAPLLSYERARELGLLPAQRGEGEQRRSLANKRRRATGKGFEATIQRSCDWYERKRLAKFGRAHPPVRGSNGHLSFVAPGQIDFFGFVAPTGWGLAFDTKVCNKASFALDLRPKEVRARGHSSFRKASDMVQVEFLQGARDCGATAFFLVESPKQGMAFLLDALDWLASGHSVRLDPDHLPHVRATDLLAVSQDAAPEYHFLPIAAILRAV